MIAQRFSLRTTALGLPLLLAGLIPALSLSAPSVSRLTPPSELFSSNQPAPVIARFMAGQRFDLQATIRPDQADKTIKSAKFMIDGVEVPGTVSLFNCETHCRPSVPQNAGIATMRAVEVTQPGLHTFSVTALQNDDQSVKATGNFEIIAPVAGGQKVRNIILMVGDGMGAAHRTAGRIVAGRYAQGKATQGLAMDSFPVTGMIKTASLNSIVTDSSPGMTAYVLGNKNNNNEEGVFPDDTLAFFDNPRIEYLSEYLHRTQGKALGIVTTADVYDATPAGNAIHTSNRRAGTGIADQFLDDRNLTGLTVLMGGGRKWFLPKGAEGSARNEKNDYVLAGTDPHTAEIVSKWGASAGKIDELRNLIADFQSSGFQYATDKTSLDAINPAQTERLLGLFAYTDMNVALDKINGRRGVKSGINGSVVANFGFPDQPMLDEMAAKAIAVLDKQKEGFVLMVEGASIDKQSHEMDTDRWVLDLLEFDRAVKVAQDYAKTRTDTLVIVTADHECSGAAVVGASMVSHDHLDELIAEGGATNVRDKVVGVYEKADFPHYQLAQDGYPEATNVDKRLLISYGANADRFEDWRTNLLPIIDTEQQPMAKNEPLRDYPKDAAHRAQEGKFFVTGQVPGAKAVHTGTDIPLSAYGPGAWSFTGVLDNTDVFFTLMQSAVGGVVTPAWIAKALKP